MKDQRLGQKEGRKEGGVDHGITEVMRTGSHIAHEITHRGLDMVEGVVGDAVGSVLHLGRTEDNRIHVSGRDADVRIASLEKDKVTGARIAAEAKRIAHTSLDASEIHVDAFVEEDRASSPVTRRSFLAGLASMFGVAYSQQNSKGFFTKERDFDSGTQGGKDTSKSETGEGRKFSEYAWEVSQELLKRYPWLEHVPLHAFYDKPDAVAWRRHIKGGRFSPRERTSRTERLARGERIFHDIGLDFYMIERGDSRKKIQDRLARYSQYAHVRQLETGDRISAFNIGERDLRAGEPLPIPLQPEHRRLEDAQLLKYILLAIEDVLISGPPRYRKVLREFIAQHGERALLMSAFAVGRHEAGAQYPGEYVLHRHEKRFNSYSYSHFHVLMRDWGLSARKHLGITEGQMMHPVNGAKVFLGFLIEKRQVWNTLPITDKSIVDFARAYNGSAHARNAYTDKIDKYMGVGERLLQELEG